MKELFANGVMMKKHQVTSIITIASCSHYSLSSIMNYHLKIQLQSISEFQLPFNYVFTLLFLSDEIRVKMEQNFPHYSIKCFYVQYQHNITGLLFLNSWTICFFSLSTYLSPDEERGCDTFNGFCL